MVDLWRSARRVVSAAMCAIRGLMWILNPTSPVGTHFWISLILAVIYRVATRGFQFEPIAQEFFYDVAVVVTANGVVLLIRFLPLRDVLRAVFKVYSFSEPAIRSGFLEYTASSLRQASSMIAGLRGEGTALTKSEVDGLATAFFIATDAQYDGVDSHEPSTYMDAFSSYLDAHALSLRRWGQRGTRVLAVNLQNLVMDYEVSTEQFESFLEWHQRNRIQLKRVDRSIAEDLRRRHNLGTIDVGVWRQKFSLHFTELELPRDERERRLALHTADTNEYRDSQAYVDEVISEAEELDLDLVRQSAGELASSTFSDIASRWGDYVDCPKRLGREGPFLLKILEQRSASRIFDSAAGIGCESIFLLKNEYNVVTNEVDPHLLAEAEKNATDAGVNLTVRTYDWLKIADSYKTLSVNKNGLFDAVLLLGNSICMLLHKDRIKDALRQLGTLLRSGGIMIVDERNFRYMADNPMKAKKLDEFPFSGEIMYCGHSIRGIPGRITKHVVVFKLIDTDIGTLLKEFNLYPFKTGELPSLLKDCGFSDVKTYYDFAAKSKTTAEFITHVATKR